MPFLERSVEVVVRFRAAGGRLSIVVSSQSGAIWRTSREISQP